jgi:arylsulfatase A-like enzyme
MTRLRTLLLLALVLLPAATGARADRPMNVVVFLADDLGQRDLGSYGSRFHETPNLDRLAREGARFSDGYSACPVCSPTRASLLTGQWPQRTGITDYIGAPGAEAWKRNTRLLPAPYADRLALETPTMAEILRQAGYATFFAGKWHLGPEGWWPENQGFEHNLGGIDRGGPYGGKQYFSPYGNPRLKDGPDGEHLPDRLAEETVAFMRANRDRPFLAYFSFYDVHTPLMARPDLQRKYEEKRERLGLSDRWGREGERDVREVQSHAVYAAMVEAMDQAAGKVLAAIDDLGLRERTLVIFTSDNGGLSTSEGWPTSNLPLRGGKGWMYEGGIRVPLLVRWPGASRPGSVVSAPAATPDLLPTVLDATGSRRPAELSADGRSLRSALAGQAEPERALFWDYPHYGNQGSAPASAVRRGPWKLIHWREGDRTELYHLGDDPGERDDLARREPARVSALRSELDTWRRAVGVKVPAANPAYDAAKPSGRAATRRGATTPARPNVVVFLADDAGWGDYSIHGNMTIATPAIDRIGAEGARFQHFYVQPVCAPTRAEFLTGRYHPRGGVRGVSTGRERLDLSERTLAEDLRTAGYATGLFGKWHNGSQWPYHPRARGFGEFVGYTHGHWGEYFDAPLEEDGRMIRTPGYIVDVCTDRALDFIDRNAGRPFFCFVSFTTPHTPWGVPAEDWQRWKDRPLRQPATLADREKPEETRAALAMMENQDRNVGRVLQRLEALRLTENTIVIYFSDNGPNTFRWNGGLRSRKGSTDEGGVRSPLIVRWPAGLPGGGRVIEEPAGAIDLRPTVLTLAAVPRVGDAALDGRDLTPLLRGTGPAGPERLLFASWNNEVSVRSARHRLDAQGRLYDVAADPGQTQPLNEREPQLASALVGAVARWRAEVLGTSGTGGPAVDPRPIPVGYREFPVTPLPARDAEPSGTVRRSSSAPNSSYFVNWTSTEDRIVWRVAVKTAGRYAVAIDYTCPVADAGARVELRFGSAALAGKVEPGWDPPLYTNQDTLPRPPAESRLKPFRSLALGVITLPAGEGELTLRATEIPGTTVMDLQQLTLTLLP